MIELLSIKTDGGRVGVGNAYPAYKLDVAGDINLTGDIRKNGTVWNPSGGGTFPVSGNQVTISATNGLAYIDGTRIAGDTVMSGPARAVFTPTGLNDARMKISGIATPAAADDAATKGYVDAAVPGAASTFPWVWLQEGEDITQCGNYYTLDDYSYGDINLDNNVNGLIRIVYLGTEESDFPYVGYEDAGLQNGFRLNYGGSVTFAVINGVLYLIQAKNFTGNISN
jgi:hypothetical protein